MLEEFKKVNNSRQQRKYLDKVAAKYRKEEMNDNIANEVLELHEYLEKNHFYKLYEGYFEDLVQEAKTYKQEQENEQLISQFNENQKKEYDEIISIAFDYDKPIECLYLDEKGNEVSSILIQSKNLPDEQLLKKSHTQVEYAIIQAILNHGSIHLKKGIRTLKKFKSLS
ncbi:hypothetical protein [Floccifex sp.]|uniref:hypothetical protein n=1 Tax=Floccifex sp. TaxID=2815810 RepID=UPI002A764E4E|nr:hypothetical protein [Floccifex sp.]MDD7280991.1 hypothetical protein [Erysipelotrichaceae bacterium]MDY2958935.1 hypothetical protein [Floccifex sp.]